MSSRARVVVLAGPSGSGKSRLAARLGHPVLRLDDFYREGDDPALPRINDHLVDWDAPESSDLALACTTIERLCHVGSSDVPVYDIAANARTGHRMLELGDSRVFVAEGLFAPHIAPHCRRNGLLAEAICVRHHRLVTFALRFVRDLREHRKPPLVLLARGWRLMRAEPAIVREAVSYGCRPMTPSRAEALLRRLSPS